MLKWQTIALQPRINDARETLATLLVKDESNWGNLRQFVSSAFILADIRLEEEDVAIDLAGRHKEAVGFSTFTIDLEVALRESGEPLGSMADVMWSLAQSVGDWMAGARTSISRGSLFVDAQLATLSISIRVGGHWEWLTICIVDCTVTDTSERLASLLDMVAGRP